MWRCPRVLDLSAIEEPAPPSAFYGYAPEERGLKGLPAWLLAGPPIAGLADAYTTDRVLSDTGPGARELNPIARPLVGNDALLYGVKVGIGALVSAAAQKAAKKGHRKAGTLAAILGMLGPGALALHNVRQHRRAK